MGSLGWHHGSEAASLADGRSVNLDVKDAAATVTSVY